MKETPLYITTNFCWLFVRYNNHPLLIHGFNRKTQTFRNLFDNIGLKFYYSRFKISNEFTTLRPLRHPRKKTIQII